MTIDADAGAAGDPTGGPERRSFQDRMLDGIEKAGNKVPHPVIMFLYLIAFIAVLSTGVIKMLTEKMHATPA
jgi:p-aminobenzoyl-glutamate transporter AbgT